MPRGPAGGQVVTTSDLARLEAATRGLEPPFAVVDLDALHANADDLVRRAGGLPVRVASKSVRVRSLLDDTLARPGYAGIMAYSLAEAVWLVERGARDVLVGYPAVDRATIARVAQDATLASAITLMVDGTEHLDLLASAGVAPAALRLCLDVDASLRVGRIHLGVRRSPSRTPTEVAALARRAVDAGHRVVGVMFYDAQIAGLPDTSLAVRVVKQLSDGELRRRRPEVVAAVERVVGAHGLEIVNGGGTGSLHVTGRDGCLTELAAGSGLYGPTLFDGYRDFAPRPAAFYALSVVRRPGPRLVTAWSGGYVASGAPGWSRVPSPVAAQGLRLIKTEAAGEVQTPLRGRAADGLHLGDRVWMRHAKAGELMEHLAEVHVVEGDRVVRSVPTYRGEGRTFG